MDGLESGGRASLFEVVDITRSADPSSIAIVTSNGRLFEFPTEQAVSLPLPGDCILHIVCDNAGWRTVRALYIVEVEETGEGWLVNPNFPVWPDELTPEHWDALSMVDHIGPQAAPSSAAVGASSRRRRATVQE